MFQNNSRVISSRTVSFIGNGGGTGVGAPSPAWEEMNERWCLIEDLLAGTDRMRERGEIWLPKEPAEKLQNFKIRLQRSFLYNGLRDTIEKLTAKPFSKLVKMNGEFGDERLDDLVNNMDGEGTDLTQFASDLFESVITYGRVHIYVSYPTVSGETNKAQEATIRPALRMVKAPDVIGWKPGIDINGSKFLDQARIHETIEVPSGKYATRTVDQIRVLNSDGTWELHSFTQAHTWQETEVGTHTFGKVPLITIYAKKPVGGSNEFMMSEPPLFDLAELNLCHWQSSADHRNCLRFARICMLGMTGVSEEQVEEATVISPNGAFKSTNPSARFFYIEPTGSAITVGERDLKALEDRMEVLGMQPLVSNSGNQLATSRAIDESKNETTIQKWIRAVENGIEDAFELLAEFLGIAVPEDFSIEIFSDFGIGGQKTDAQVIMALLSGNHITLKTALSELKRRGLLGDNVDVEKEAALAEADAANFMNSMIPPNPNSPLQPKNPAAPGSPATQVGL